MKIAYWGLGILLTLPLSSIAAQSQAAPQDVSASSTSSSLVEAARRARESKKDQATPPRVWNNDTIPKAGDEISVVGPSAASSSNSATSPGNSTSSGTAANSASAKGEDAGTSGSKSRSALENQITNAKEKLATIKTDLDILQRTYTLDSQMYYGKPDYSTDKEGAAKLKDEQEQIAAKQQEMDDQQKKIDDLEAEEAKLGPASGAEPASTEESK